MVGIRQVSETHERVFGIRLTSFTLCNQGIPGLENDINRYVGVIIDLRAKEW